MPPSRALYRRERSPMSGLGRRGDALAGLSERSFDVLVVGGGIVGAGVLLEATLRGYRAALVERNDFASGTSSRSSKLVHGGLRYLARGEVGIERGAIVANHIAALRRRRWGDRVRTALRDERGGATIEVEARCVVVAVGAHFGDARADFDWRAMALRPAKGIHAVLRVTPRDANVLIRSPRDGRYLNTLPWHGHVLAGTTDTPASREEIDDPRPSAEDVAYVLDAVRPLYPDSDKRVRAAWAGIRPLINAGGATTVGLSREDEIASPEPGVLAVAGGKMTTYQAMARRTMDLVDRNIGRRRASEEAPLDDPLPPSGKRLVS